eukprot:CAMPEP_0184692142 /NCGR_PEP_ID=MMETSP0313-20130426/748_1 /TAXON_ID=2792 /ORGANISM="Porphyridium aerugineum, Strain SAG 1380-2" /LENGTH=200 /DNA_ID=CAMNT_0027149951 /DNA_START=109 /DNA_END=711 /DNA_ORIENTATION=-
MAEPKVVTPQAPINPLSTSFFSPIHATDISIKEKGLSFTGDSSSVTDAKTNQPLFQIKASMVSMSQRRSLTDNSGKEIGQVRLRKSPGLHRACYIGTANDEKLVCLKTTGSLNITKCDAEILDKNDKEIGKIHGDWRAKHYEIEINHQVVALCKRSSMNAAGLLFDADSYHVHIAPNVCAAFVTFLVLGMDELYHDNPGQ